MKNSNFRLTYRCLFISTLIFIFFGIELNAQTEVTGNITSDGIALIGATVQVKNTSNGVVTDIDGAYSIIIMDANATLVVSYIGYETTEIAVNGRKMVNIELAEALSQLEEIVVVGFGSKKKAHVTGAAASLDMKDVLSNRPVTNPMTALQGTIPGLQITGNSGQPGSTGLGINIRGITSINGGSPLILLNNVPVSSEDINPQDVESITVLKDAAASSIYGARAAFGVILITTKTSAKNQPVQFNYSTTLSINRPEDIPDKASTYDFIHALDDWNLPVFWTGQDIPSWVGFVDEYRANPNTYPLGYAEKDGLRYPLADTDLIGAWLDDPGATQIHNFSFNGGGENIVYRVSAGYSDEDGIIVTRNDSYRKYNINALMTSDITSKLTATANVLYRNSIQRTPLGSYGNAITFNAYTPSDGNHLFDDGTEVPYDTPKNRELLKEAPKLLRDNVRLFGKAEYDLFKGMKVIGEYTFEKKNFDQISTDNQILTVNPERFVLNAVDPVNTFYRRYNQRIDYNAINLYTSYDVDFNDHGIGMIAGYNQENSDIESFWVRKSNLINVDLPSISGATGTITSDDSFGEWAVRGFFGRFNYNYKEKYFVEFNGRYDGSSRFRDGSRFGFFPSLSAGWHLGREKFLENVGFLSDLKLRGSWGEIGNQNTLILGTGSQDYYPAIPGMNVENASWLNESAGVPYVTLGLPSLVSSAFTWERVETLNFGLDAVFLKGRLSTTLDIFTRKTIGMLIPGAELPAVLGVSAPTQNAADLESKGWELALSWNDQISDFSYSVGATLSDNTGRITKFDNPAGLISQYYIGQDIGEIWGYTTDGYYTEADFEVGSLDENLLGGTLKEGIPYWEGRTQNPGDIKFKDLDGDGIITDGNNTLENSGDRSIIGNNTRRYQYGLFTNASFKNFDISFLLNGVAKRQVYQNNNVRFPYTK